MSAPALARCRHCGAEFREDELNGVENLDELECGFCGHVGTIRTFPGQEPAWYEPARKTEREPMAPEGASSEEIDDRPPPARGRGKTP